MTDATRSTVAAAARTLLRVGCVALAVVGALSLFGVRLGARDARCDAAKPAEPEPEWPEPRVVAAIARVHADVAARVEDLDRTLRERDEAEARRLEAALAELRRAVEALPAGRVPAEGTPPDRR